MEQLYGMGPQKLSHKLQITVPEAKQLLNLYWTSFPNIKNFFDDFVATSVKNRCVRSPYDNRLRWLEGFDFDARKDLARIKNMTMNFPMQSGNASITKIALTNLREELKRKKHGDVKILCAIHDKFCRV